MEGKKLGEKGEAIAAEYLKREGHQILDRNWSARGRWGKQMGELDIVAKKGKDILFVEVKAGTSRNAAWRPETHVTPRKAERLRRAAQVWLAAHRKLHVPWQIDVIAVDFVEGSLPKLRHIRSAVFEKE